MIYDFGPYYSFHQIQNSVSILVGSLLLYFVDSVYIR